jgi:adenylate cyclase
MAQEIERKFLIAGNFKPFVSKEISITQGYLSSKPERTVRVRTEGKVGYITIKGIPNSTGISRFEWEKKIPLVEAKQLLKICQPSFINKTRYIIPEKSGLKFEVDVFYGDNEGLTIAEIELPTEDYIFEKPEWLGKEVTTDVRYSNAMLAKNPFTKW